MNKKDILGMELRNSKGGWFPGMQLRNASGDVDVAGFGYQYSIKTTTFIRSQVIQQKFYEIPFADFVDVEVGTGAWMEEITQNLQYDIAGDFETGIQNVGANNTELAMVDVGLSAKKVAIITWAKGYRWAIAEIEKALAANNWDVVQGRVQALKRNWDLGLQYTAFLGSKSRSTVIPGLLNNSDVTVDSTVITSNISAMDATAFQTLVAGILSAYFANSNSTQMPNMFVMPMDDFLGMGAASSSAYPLSSKLEYLKKAFVEITGNAGFQIKGVVYSQKAKNAGVISVAGKQRYCLYNKNPESVRMYLPVPFTLTSPGTADNFYWKGVGYGQYTGVVAYRPAEVLYLDNPNA